MAYRNFLITYSGRVGSTALIDHLKLIPDVVVPVFEELDYWHLEQRGALDETTPANIHHAVDSIYAGERDGRPASSLSLGFKWRPWGDVAAVASVLKRRDVLVFNLTRADIIEFIGSLYLSDVVYKEFNSPQFMLRDAATQEERQQILFRYRMTPVEVDLDKYFALCQERLAEEKARMALLRQLENHGVEIRTIFYEDFTYKKFHFLSAVLSALRLPALTAMPVTKLAKVSSAFPSELFTNRQALFDSPRLMEIVREWETLLYLHGFKPLI
jgi:hypothetical protein